MQGRYKTAARVATDNRWFVLLYRIYVHTCRYIYIYIYALLYSRVGGIIIRARVCECVSDTRVGSLVSSITSMTRALLSFPESRWLPARRDKPAVVLLYVHMNHQATLKRSKIWCAYCFLYICTVYCTYYIRWTPCVRSYAQTSQRRAAIKRCRDNLPLHPTPSPPPKAWIR